MTFISYAQNFEDVMLWRALKHVESGFYIDVGAAHPDDYSVTRAFYDRGWRGINIEPTSRVIRLTGARPRDINLHMAVGCIPGEVTIFVVEGNKDISTVDPAIAEGHRAAGWAVREERVPVATLGDICRAHVEVDIHFLKIDAEGAERDVLLGADFKRFRPWVVVIEATAPNSQTPTHTVWEDLLTIANYRFAWFDGLNRFYIAGEHWEQLSSALAVPPNVFDDFIRATDTEHLSKIVGAEARTAMAEARIAEFNALAAGADRRASRAEEQTAQTEARAQAAEARAQAAEARAQAAEARAQAAEARAQVAEGCAARAERSLAETAAQHRAALAEGAALRASTSWRVTAPLRVVGWLLSRHLGAALMEAGIAPGRVERMKSFAGSDGGAASRASRIAYFMARNTARFGQVTPARWPRLWLARRASLVSAADSTHAKSVASSHALAQEAVATANASSLAYRVRTVHQFHPGSSPGDAITNSMFLIQRWLHGLGYESDIFVEHRNPQLIDRLFEIDDLPLHGDYVLIVHHSMGYDACERVAALPARKVLMYHNITPSAFLGDFPELIPYAELGRKQLELLRPHVVAALADSEFNALELRANGYDQPVACPFLFDVDQLIANAARGAARPDGSHFTILFVGRVVASKGQADLVDAFAEFRCNWSAPCRLVLVGRMASADAEYPSEIRRRVNHHNLQDEVLVTGLVSDTELTEWYRAADLFVSLSLHEGFGVPLVEAMAHGVPVLAWPAGAVPYTLGGGGELLMDRSPPAVAAAMLRIARDPVLRANIVDRQRRALGRFRLDRQVPLLTQALANAGAAPPSQWASRQALSANLRFTIIGHLLGTYSLAAINRRLAMSLEHYSPGAVRVVPWENGPVADLSLVPTGPAAAIATLVSRPEHLTGPEVVISQHYPIHVPSHRGDLTIAFVFWEECLLPADTIRVLNNGFDAVLAPSAHVADALINSGLSVPVRIVGVAPDLTVLQRLGTERKSFGFDTGRLFTFLHVSSCFPRKGVDVLLAAYAIAFRKGDPVRLVIKGFPNPHNDVPEQIERLLQRDPDVAEIIMINNDIDDTEMLELYRGADAVVLPTRGEGFNLPAAEAMAAGVPLIVTDHGGHLDFCTAEEARLVKSHFTPSHSHLTSAGSVWAEPDPDDLVAALREIFNDITMGGRKCAARAQRARETIGERLDTDAWAERVSNAAVELLTAPRPKPLRVAWVSTWAVRCGIAEYSRLLVERLLLHRDPVGPTMTVLCDERTVASSDGDEIRVCPSWRLGDSGSMAQLARAVSNEDPDVVVIQYHRGILPWDALTTLISNRRVSRRIIVVTLHAAQHLLDLDPEERATVVTALGRGARVLVHSLADMELLRRLGLGRNVALFPHGAPAPIGTPLVRTLTQSAAPIIGCHGFFLPGKGIPRLIEAVAQLRSTWPYLRLRLVNAEYPVPESATEIAQCRALAESLGLNDAIEWVTAFRPLDECLRALSGCDLLVLPYDHSEESSSAALRGALSSGVPTAVTPVAIFEEANEAVHRFAGVDVKSTTTGIDALLRDTEARTRLQQSASAWLAQHDWGSVAERMLGMLTGLHVARPAYGMGDTQHGKLSLASGGSLPPNRDEPVVPVH
jgi:FkbM family methyltransferase